MGKNLSKKIEKWVKRLLVTVMIVSLAIQNISSVTFNAAAQDKKESQNLQVQEDKTDQNISSDSKNGKNSEKILEMTKNSQNSTDATRKDKNNNKKEKIVRKSSLSDIKGEKHESETMKYISDMENEKIITKAETTAEKKLDEDSAPSKKILDANNMSDDLIPTAHRMTLNYLYVDKKYTNADSTIDSVWAKSQKMNRNFPVIGSFLSYSQLYALKDNPNVYVTFADSGRFNGLSKATYADFSDGDTSNPKNYNSQVKFDKNTGIIYIPRSLFTDEDGKDVAKTLYGQLLVPFTLPKNRNVKNDIDIKIDNKRTDVKSVFTEKTLNLASFNTVTTIPVSKKSTASNLSPDKITVYVNDETIPHSFSAGEYQYDRKTGILKLKVMPSNVYKIKVVLDNDSSEEKIAKAFAETAYAYVVPVNKISEYLNVNGTNSTLSFSSDTVSNGAIYEIPNRSVYYNSNGTSWTGNIDETCEKYRDEYAKYCYYFNSDEEGAELNHIIGDPNRGLSTWRDNESSLLVKDTENKDLYSFLFSVPKAGGSKYSALNGASGEAAMELSGDWPKYLPLHCAHTLDGYSESRYSTNEKSDVKMRILSSQWNDENRNAKTGDWAVIGFVIDEDTGEQQSQGVYKVKIKVETPEDVDGSLTVEKIWDDNNASSRPDPVIYAQKTDSDDKYSSSDDKVCKLTKDGNTWTYEFTLPKGQYKVWEGDLSDSHYISSNPSSNKIETETGDTCTITNTCLKIKVKKKWEDNKTNDKRKTPNIQIAAPTSSVYIRSDILNKRELIDGDGKELIAGSNNILLYYNYSFDDMYNGGNDEDYDYEKGYQGIINHLFGYKIENILYASNISSEDDVPKDAKRIDNKYFSKKSEYKVYAWEDGKTVYYWTNANIIKLTNSTRHLFAYFPFLKKIDLQKIDTSEMTDMSFMFAGDGYINGYYNIDGSLNSSLNLDLSTFDTSNVTNMDSMFSGVFANSIDLRTFDASKVTVSNATYMFLNAVINSVVDMRNFNFIVDDQSPVYFGAYYGTFYYPSDKWTHNTTDTHENVIAGKYKSPKTPTLKKQKLSYSYKDGDCTISKDGDTWTYTFYVENNALTYDAWEDELDGYVTNHTKSSKGQTSLNDILTITNTEQKTRDVKVIKEWDDSDTDHNAVQVQLYRNNKSMGDDYKVTLNSSNNWTYTWKNLDMTDKDGVNYNYTVKEGDHPNYIAQSTVKILSDGTYEFTITNTKVDSTYFNVEKKWEDDDDADGIRPKRLKVQLYSISKSSGTTAYGNEVILSAANNWAYSWPTLRKINDDGEDVTYTAKEVGYSNSDSGDDFINIDDNSSIPDYYTGYSTDENNNKETIINFHTQYRTSFSVNKVWDDENDGEGIRPSSVTVSLYADGSKIDGEDQTLSDSNNWSYTWTDLPKRKNGKDIVYSAVEENVPTGYAVSYDTSKNGAETVTNKHVPEKVSVMTDKVWNDEKDKLGFRPTAIKVTLYKNGSEYDTQVLNASNQWKYKWTGLYKKNKEGTISYTVKETAYSRDGSTYIDENPLSYRVSVSDDEDLSNDFQYTLTNTLQKTVNAEKNWDDNGQTYSRPSKITYALYAGGVEIDRKDVTAADKWHYSWTGLSAFNDDGSEIKYSVKEINLDAYESSVNETDDKDEAIQTFTFTNKAKDTVGVSVNKKWSDANNTGRPKAIKAQLYADDEPLYDPVILNSDNSWQHTWSNLVKYKEDKAISYTVKETAYSADGSSFTNGIPDGYTCSYSDDSDKTDSFSYTMTNTMKTKVIVTKTWNDNEYTWSRPDKITVELNKNGVLCDSYDLYDIDSENSTRTHWKHTWDNLPLYDSDGNEITYSVTEAAYVTNDYGYKSEITDTSSSDSKTEKSFTITNTPVKTSVSVNKVWADSDNKNKVRPTKIKVQLFENSSKLNDPVELSADSDTPWAYTWTNLPAKRNNDAIKYTVKEVAYSTDGTTWTDGVPPEYTESYTNNSNTSITITDTEDTTVTVEKDWKDGLTNDEREKQEISPVIHLTDSTSRESTVHLRKHTSSSYKSPFYYAFPASTFTGSIPNIAYASEITNENDVPENAARIDRNYSDKDAKYKVYTWTEKNTSDSTSQYIVKYWTNADKIIIDDNNTFADSYFYNIDIEKMSFADLKTAKSLFGSYGSQIKKIEIKDCRFDNLTDASHMFDSIYPQNDSVRISFENVSFPKLTNVANMFSDVNPANISFDNVYFPKLKSVEGMFYTVGIDSLAFNNCHFPQLESFSNMESGCHASGTSSIAITNMDFPCVTEVSKLASYYPSQGTLTLKNLNFQSPTTMTQIVTGSFATLNIENVTGDIVSLYKFLYQTGPYLQKISIKDFDTSNVTDMSYMFSNNNSELTSLDLSCFDTSNVRNMSHMFASGYLKNINLSSFDTSNVCDMSHMFTLYKVNTLDLSTFDTSKVTADNAAEEMFNDATIKKIYIGDNWTLDESEMPYVCPKLNGYTPGDVTAYSYTQNLNSDGTKNSDYGNNWNNSNIRGTGRSSSFSSAHPIYIPHASKIHVKITYGGESASYDWACMWKGSYGYYTAARDYSSSLTGKLGGGSHMSSSNTKEYDITDASSVTFSFKSDGSGVGDGYGYYAVVTGTSPAFDGYEYKRSERTAVSRTSVPYTDYSMNENNVYLRSDNSELCNVEKVSDSKWLYHFYVKDSSKSYKAYEDDLHGYRVDHDSANPVSLPNAVITNTPYTPTGNLQISKVLNASSQSDKDFDFTITKLNDDGTEDNSFSGSFDVEKYSNNEHTIASSPKIPFVTLRMDNSYNIVAGTTTSGDSGILVSTETSSVSFKKGKATVSLKEYQSLMVEYLPIGTYEITEQDELYTASHYVMPGDAATSKVTLTEGSYIIDRVTNTRSYRNLVISKALKGKTKGTYKFKIDFSNMYGDYEKDAKFKTVYDDYDENKNVMKISKTNISSDGWASSTGNVIQVHGSDSNTYAIDESKNVYLLNTSNETPTVTLISDLSQYSSVSQNDDGDIVITDNDSQAITVKENLHVYNASGVEYTFNNSNNDDDEYAMIVKKSHKEPDRFVCYCGEDTIIYPDDNGNASAVITIDASGSEDAQAVIKNIPSQTKYKITELSNDSIGSYEIKNGDDVIDSGNNTVSQKDLPTKEHVLSKEDKITAAFTNTGVESGSLEISKSVVGKNTQKYANKWKRESYDKALEANTKPSLDDIKDLTPTNSDYVDTSAMKGNAGITSFTSYVYSNSDNQLFRASSAATKNSVYLGTLATYINDEKIDNGAVNLKKGWNKVQLLLGTNEGIVSVNTNLGNLSLAEPLDKIESASVPDSESDTEFKFKVSLKNEASSTYISGDKTFGEISFKNGVGYVSLKAGKSVIISGLPAGTEYTVEECDTDHYIPETESSTGTIANDKTSEVSIINDYLSGSMLNFSKHVDGTEEQKSTSYPFTASLTGLEAGRTYTAQKTTPDDLLTHRNLLLKSINRTAKNYYDVNTAPEEKYDDEGYITMLTKTVSSDVDHGLSGYWIAFSHPLEKGKTYTLSFDYESSITDGKYIDFIPCNFYEGPDVGQINKSTSGETKFTCTFEQTIASDDSNAVHRPYGLWINMNSAGQGDWLKISHLKLEEGKTATDWTPAPEDLTTRFTADSDGKATLTSFLKDNESVKIESLPDDAKYSIKETYESPALTTTHTINGSKDDTQTSGADTGEKSITASTKVAFNNKFDVVIPLLPDTGSFQKDLMLALALLGLFISFILYIRKKCKELEQE